MNYSLKIVANPDKEIRFEFQINEVSKGELMMSRDETLRFAELIFGKDYKIVGDNLKSDE